jgi:hypothetical protein
MNTNHEFSSFYAVIILHLSLGCSLRMLNCLLLLEGAILILHFGVVVHFALAFPFTIFECVD